MSASVPTFGSALVIEVTTWETMF